MKTTDIEHNTGDSVPLMFADIHSMSQQARDPATVFHASRGNGGCSLAR